MANSQVYRTLERLAQKRLLTYPTSKEKMKVLRRDATIRCDYKIINPNRCNPSDEPNQVCLYDIKRDPCELNNLTPFYPNVASYLFRALVQHRESLVPQESKELQQDLADPVNFNGTWTPWIDSNGVPFVVTRSGTGNFNIDPLSVLTSDYKDSFLTR